MAPLDGVVSQLMVELPWTLKGQHGVEFDFQSIKQHFISLSRKNAGFFGLFPQFLGFTGNVFKSGPIFLLL